MKNGKAKPEEKRLCQCDFRPRVDIHFGDALYRCKCGGVYPGLTPEETARRVQIVQLRHQGHTH